MATGVNVATDRIRVQLGYPTPSRRSWEATPGSHELRCRARDAAGNSQPGQPAWNAHKEMRRAKLMPYPKSGYQAARRDPG